jgi:hypothetical protein
MWNGPDFDYRVHYVSINCFTLFNDYHAAFNFSISIHFPIGLQSSGSSTDFLVKTNGSFSAVIPEADVRSYSVQSRNFEGVAREHAKWITMLPRTAPSFIERINVESGGNQSFQQEYRITWKSKSKTVNVYYCESRPEDDTHQKCKTPLQKVEPPATADTNANNYVKVTLPIDNFYEFAANTISKDGVNTPLVWYSNQKTAVAVESGISDTVIIAISAVVGLLVLITGAYFAFRWYVQ